MFYEFHLNLTKKFHKTKFCFCFFDFFLALFLLPRLVVGKKILRRMKTKKTTLKERLVEMLPPKEVKKFLIYFYAIGTIGLLFPLTREIFIYLIPYTLMLSFVLLLFFHKPMQLKIGIVFFIIAFAGYFIEVIGVNSGIIFGNYYYEYALGLKILNTPLIIGINWVMLIYCVNILFNKLNIHFVPKALIGACMMLIYDIILEPVAIKLHMWQWENNTVPLQNYLAWFLISFVFLLLIEIANVKPQNPIAKRMLMVQLGFFFLLNIFLRII
jgi:putative membrane protein